MSEDTVLYRGIESYIFQQRFYRLYTQTLDHSPENIFVMGADMTGQKDGAIWMRHRQSPTVSSSCLENGRPLALTLALV